MLFIVPECPWIGKIAKLTEFGVLLSKEYEAIFHFGNPLVDESVNYYCHCGGRYEISLMFVDEAPEKRNELTWWCLKEIGIGASGDYHWYTLDQLIMCN